MLKRMLQDALDAGGNTDDAEIRGNAIEELGMACAVIRTAPIARRLVGLVMSGKPLVFRDGQLHEA